VVAVLMVVVVVTLSTRDRATHMTQLQLSSGREALGC
jgi:hypothetical protein